MVRMVQGLELVECSFYSGIAPGLANEKPEGLFQGTGGDFLVVGSYDMQESDFFRQNSYGSHHTHSVGFLKEPTDRAWAEDGGLRLYRAILARHARGADARDVLHLYGMAAAHALVEVLEQAGANPTRRSLLERLRSLRLAASPFLLPGIVLRTGPRDSLAVEQVRLQRREAGRWQAFGGLFGAGA